MTRQNLDMGRVTLEQSDLWRQRGYVEEDALRRLLAELCTVLGPGHDGGEVHGRVCPLNIWSDDMGGVHLDSPHAASKGGEKPVRGNQALFGVLPDGYAAFEQYMDEDAWPLGPWTDVHAVCAVAYALIVGRPPDNAVKRMVVQKPIEFTDKYRAAFSPKLLAAIARGLSTDARARQQSVDELLVGLGGLSAVHTGLLEQEELLEQDKADVDAETAQDSDKAGFDTETATDGDEDRVYSAATAEVTDNRATKKNTVGWGMPVAVVLLLAAGAGVWLLKSTDGGSGNVAVARAPEQAAAQPVASVRPALAANESVEALPREQANTSVNAAALPDEATVQQAAALAEAAPMATRTPMGQEAMALAQDQVASTEGSNELKWSVAPEGVPPLVSAASKTETPTEEAGLQQTGLQRAESQSAESEPAGAVSVRLDVQPWGEIFVDGSSRGVSPPLRQISLAPGTYQIRVQNGNLPQASQRLVVKAGEAASIQHVFANGEP